MKSPPKNRLLDIETLMKRIRQDVLDRREEMIGAPSAGDSEKYEIGTVLDFTENGNAHNFLGNGWSRIEPKFRWTEGKHAEINLEFDKEPDELILEFEAEPLTCHEVPSQQIFAEWNGIPFAAWDVRKLEICRSVVYPHLTNAGSTAKLVFRFPDAFSPLSQKINQDPRELGLAFRNFRLNSVLEFGFSV